MISSISVFLDQNAPVWDVFRSKFQYFGRLPPLSTDEDKVPKVATERHSRVSESVCECVQLVPYDRWVAEKEGGD